MTFLQKLRYSYVVLLNLFYAWIFPNFGLRLATDASIGLYLRHQNPKLYRRYYKQHYIEMYGVDMPREVYDILDVIIKDTRTN